jgi:hypothetical protein
MPLLELRLPVSHPGAQVHVRTRCRTRSLAAGEGNSRKSSEEAERDCELWLRGEPKIDSQEHYEQRSDRQRGMVTGGSEASQRDSKLSSFCGTRDGRSGCRVSGRSCAQTVGKPSILGSSSCSSSPTALTVLSPTALIVLSLSHSAEPLSLC